MNYDSVAVRLLDGAAWSGFGSALARAEGLTTPQIAARGRTVVDLRGGSHGFDENALSIARGDARGWFSGEVMEGRLGERAGFAQTGRHLWGVGMGFNRGIHGFDAGYRQRGAAAALVSTEEESAGGEAGYARYTVNGPRGRLALKFSRALDHRESSSEFFDWSRRDAQGTRLELEGATGVGSGGLAARFAWEHARVTRAGIPSEQFLIGADVVWAGLRYERRVGEGTLEVGFGGGRHEGVDKVTFAPSVAYLLGDHAVGARMAFERVLAPVWTDLAGGEDPFLQSTWAGAFEVHARGPAALARGGLLLGSTTQRARVMRLPLDELWMREGIEHDGTRRRFALTTFDGRVTRWGLEAGVEGYAVARDRAEDEAQTDPTHGLRTSGAWRFRTFSGDLGVTLRVSLDRVGARESEEFGFPGRRLPGYWTSGASVAVTLADAVLVLRVRNLEDRPREEVWIDVDTGSEALGPGREITLAATLRLSN